MFLGQGPAARPLGRVEFPILRGRAASLCCFLLLGLVLALGLCHPCPGHPDWEVLCPLLVPVLPPCVPPVLGTSRARGGKPEALLGPALAVRKSIFPDKCGQGRAAGSLPWSSDGMGLTRVTRVATGTFQSCPPCSQPGDVGSSSRSVLALQETAAEL